MREHRLLLLLLLLLLRARVRGHRLLLLLLLLRVRVRGHRLLLLLLLRALKIALDLLELLHTCSSELHQMPQPLHLRCHELCLSLAPMLW